MAGGDGRGPLKFLSRQGWSAVVFVGQLHSREEDLRGDARKSEEIFFADSWAGPDDLYT